MARPTNRELRDAAGSEFARRLSPEYMEEYCVLPLDLGDDGRLRVAVGNALNTSVLDEKPGRFVIRPDLGAPGRGLFGNRLIEEIPFQHQPDAG